MRVSDIEADTDIGEASQLKHLHKRIWCGELIWDIFHQQFDAERLGKGPQMLERGDGGFDFALAGVLIADANMLHEELEGSLLGDFDGALNLVHGSDAIAPF